MRSLTRRLFILGALLASSPAYSDVVLLIHGYLSNSSVWMQSGVVQTLESDGWKLAGMYSAYPNGQVYLHSNNLTVDENRRIMIVDLPSEAPLLLQSDLIANVVNTITVQYPDQSIILVGHSAGGLAARAALVRHDLKNVDRLVSIASPHMGTDMAEKALDISRFTGPATMLPGMFGGDIARTTQRSQQLYSDLARPRPGNLLDWLNAQTHPDINWDSIIHTGVNSNGHDSVVAAYSQDMNYVYSLQGRSTVRPIRAEHGLNPTDAIILKEILGETNRS
jgi:triacylglycerol lipase